MAPSVERVQFFIVGAQKSATTALDQMLRRHPAIEMASVKEPHVFDNDALDWTNPDFEPLHSLYNWEAAEIRLRGEATPIYLYWPQSLERLHAYNPQALIIVGLRHPAFRAFSQWRMETKRASDTLPFEEAIGAAGRARVSESPGGVHRVFSYVERGFYAGQIARLLGLFPREQVFIYRVDHLWSDPEQVLTGLQDFLGIERRLRPERRYIVPVDTSEYGPIPDAARIELLDLFRSDIQETAALTGLDLEDWLDPAYDEPIVAPGTQAAPVGA
jgi:hypothetical protein